MANANTVAAIYNNPKVVLNTTTETIITNKAGAPMQVGFSANENYDGGRPFIVNLRGTCTGGTGAFLTLKIYLASASTIGTSTAVASFTATTTAIPVAGGNFDVAAEFSWDSFSGVLNGYVYGQTNGKLTPYALTAVPAAITSISGLQFVASAQFAAALATNSVSVTEFSIAQG